MPIYSLFDHNMWKCQYQNIIKITFYGIWQFKIKGPYSKEHVVGNSSICMILYIVYNIYLLSNKKRIHMCDVFYKRLLICYYTTKWDLSLITCLYIVDCFSIAFLPSGWIQRCGVPARIPLPSGHPCIPCSKPWDEMFCLWHEDWPPKQGDGLAIVSSYVHIAVCIS